MFSTIRAKKLYTEYARSNPAYALESTKLSQFICTLLSLSQSPKSNAATYLDIQKGAIEECV